MRRNPLAALVGIAAVAGALASVVREYRAAVPASPAPAGPVALRRELHPDEAAALRSARAAAANTIHAYWSGLATEDVARLAMAWPAQWTTSERPQ